MSPRHDLHRRRLNVDRVRVLTAFLVRANLGIGGRGDLWGEHERGAFWLRAEWGTGKTRLQQADIKLARLGSVARAGVSESASESVPSAIPLDTIAYSGISDVRGVRHAERWATDS